MIYTGERGDRPKKLSLSEEFFGGRRTAVEVTVKVLNGENREDVIGQYVRFCRVFNAQTRLHGLTDTAVRETIRICRDEDVLKSYPEEHEKEAVGIMMAPFDKEYIRKAYGKEKYDEGEAEDKDRQARMTALNLYAAGMPMERIARMIGHAENTVAEWIAAAP